MPIYQVKSPSGQVIEIKGESPPSRAIIENIFKQAGLAQDTPIETSPAEQLRQQALGGTLSPEVGQELVAQDEAANIDPRIKLAQASAADPEAMERHGQKLVKEREARVEAGKGTFADTLSRNLFTKEAATPGQAILGASNLLARGLGAMTFQGDLADEDTSLFKEFKQDLTDWSSSREAQNTTADTMIGNLRTTLSSSTEIPEEMKAEIESQIAEIEKSKNSGALTTATDVVGGLMLGIGEDPIVLKSLLKGVVGIGKGVVKKAFPKTVESITQKTLDTTTDRLLKFGVRNKKMIDFIDEQPGKNVKQKLTNIRRRQTGELTPSGKIQDESIEAMFDERTLASLEKNADNIQTELDRVKDVGADVRESIALKKEARKDVAQAEKESGIAEEEIKGIKKKTETEDVAKKVVEDVESEVTATDIVESVINKNKIKNVGFEEAEEIAKQIPVSQLDAIKTTKDMLIKWTGGATKGRTYNADAIALTTELRANASLEEIGALLRKKGYGGELAEPIFRVKRRNVSDLKKSKDILNKAIARNADPTDITTQLSKEAKANIDEVVKRTAGDSFKGIQIAEKAGGETRDAANSLYSAMGIAPTKAGIINETVVKSKAISKLDEFLEKEAKKFADNGFKPTPAMGKKADFAEWKKHFGFDARKEVESRAKKLGITSEAKGKIKEIDVDVKEAQKAIVEASASTKQKIDRYAKQSADQVKKGIKRRITEIRQALSKAKTEKALKGNVASDFRSEVKHFAGEGGFSKNTESFKTFESKYGSKLSDMVEDQAIFSTFNVSPTGKITNAEDLLSSFKGVRVGGVGQGPQVAAFAEGIFNKVYSKLVPFESRLNKAMNKIKASNAQLSKELNRMKKKAIKKGEADPTKEQFRLLMEQNPLVTADIMSSEFKFFDVLSFMDKAFIVQAANSTGNEFTNKQRMSAKRILVSLKKKGK